MYMFLKLRMLHASGVALGCRVLLASRIRCGLYMKGPIENYNVSTNPDSNKAFVRSTHFGFYWDFNRISNCDSHKDINNGAYCGFDRDLNSGPICGSYKDSNKDSHTGSNYYNKSSQQCFNDDFNSDSDSGTNCNYYSVSTELNIEVMSVNRSIVCITTEMMRVYVEWNAMMHMAGVFLVVCRAV